MLHVDPSDIIGLQLWLDADKIQNVDDNEQISVWEDSSGNNNDFVQNDSDKQPTYMIEQVNGKPAISFDGIDDSLDASIGNLSAYTIFAVFKFDNMVQPDNDYDYVISIGEPGATTHSSIARWKGNEGDSNKNCYYHYTSSVSVGPYLTGETWLLLDVVHNPPRLEHAIRGFNSRIDKFPNTSPKGR